MTTATFGSARLRENQLELAAGILARAFHTDPPFVYIISDPAERERILLQIMRTFVTYAHLFGEPLTTAGTPEAVALWLPLADLSEATDRDRQAGIDRIPRICGAEAFARLMHVVGLAEKFHRHCAPGKHMYLQFLGVEPLRQGKRLGSSLITPIIERADAEGVPCYLETFQPRNLPLYQKHGFKIMIEDIEPNSGLRGWGFLREPE
jgi:GNAT superfamily N-acetyltransferase